MKAVNPKAVQEVKVGEATFRIGVIPFGRRTEIESQAMFSGKAETPDELKQLMLRGYDFVKWGVKGHSGLSFEDGTEVPFARDEDGSVSAETMEIYAATPGLLVDLQKHVTDFNYLRKDVVKN